MTKRRGGGHECEGSWTAGREGPCLNPGPLDDVTRGKLDGDVPIEGASLAAAGPSQATLPFDQVYEQYFELVWRSLRMLGVQQASLDDAVQDVFGTVARQLPRFEGRSSLRTWIFGIAQYTAMNHRRSVRRKNGPLEPLHEGLTSSEPSPHAQAEARQLASVIFRFCEELDEGRRTVFVLALLEEVPAAEIAELLSIPVNTVYSRKRALERALRERLEQHGLGGEPSTEGLARGQREVEQ
jgi:RNA polymerase sigma-70 factor, ECF subfamily